MASAVAPQKHMNGSGPGQTCSLCHGFMRIPPLIRGGDGRVYANPDFEMVKRFHLAAEPFGGAAGTIPAGGFQEFSLTPPAEDESLGDMLVNELFLLTDPVGARDISFEILSNQTDKLYMNARVFNTLIMGNAQLNCCLPCCFLIQATNTVQLRVQNDELVPVEIRIVARGKRFLPRGRPDLRQHVLQFWNSIPSQLYFLTLDPAEVLVPSGATVTTTMTVPGTGDFEVKWPRCEVRSVGATTAEDILVSVSEGIGRRWESRPIPLGAFVAAPTLAVAGFPGGLFRAASACHCPPFTQLFKRNTRVRVTFENTGPADADVRLTFAGCMHYVPECPPGRSMDRIRSLEPTIGPMLVPQEDYCPPAGTMMEEAIAEPFDPGMLGLPARRPFYNPIMERWEQ